MAKKLYRHKSIKAALEYVSRHPTWPDSLTSRLEMPVWELVARHLFDMANYPDNKIPGSLRRATRAQKIILDRLSGTRRTGTVPAARGQIKITLKDLTGALNEHMDEKLREASDGRSCSTREVSQVSVQHSGRAQDLGRHATRLALESEAYPSAEHLLPHHRHS